MTGRALAPGAALYECRITHTRLAPLRNVFTYRTYQWLVDLDQLPRPGRFLRLLAGFDSRDHLGDPQRPIRDNLDRFLMSQGIDTRSGRVVMLAHARVLGYVFNPLTVYWCHRADGTLACVVAEVHNTYRQRHAYLLRPDERGRAQVPKEFYVSPFYPVDGGYRMSLPEPGLPEPGLPAGGGPHPSALALSITLTRPDGNSFVASVHGTGLATARALLSAAARHPWSTMAVSARIRWQGIRLYLRGLPVVPRPPHREQPHQEQPHQEQPHQEQPYQGQPHQTGQPSQPATGSPTPGERTVSISTQQAPRARRRRRTVARRRRGGRLRERAPWRGPCSPRPWPAFPARVQFPGRTAARRGPAVRSGDGPAPAREFFRRFGASGLIGFGESYMAGDWDCADLTGLLTVLARARGELVPPWLQRMRALAVRAAAVRRPADPRAAPAGTSAVTTTCPTTCSPSSSTRP